MTNAPANAFLVVARILQTQGIYGLQPVERLITDSQGRISSLETNLPDVLPGITGSGEYVVAQVTQPQVLVKGIAQNSSGQPAGGLLVSLGPWTTLSRSPDGQFLLIAAAMDNQLSITDLGTGDTGQSDLPISAGQLEVNPTAGTTLAGPQVVDITPTNNAANISLVTSVTIDFSRALNPATLLAANLQLLDASNQPVTATMSLNLANTTVTLLPSAQLLNDTTYTVALSTNITDTLGRPLQGQNLFYFTTVPVSVRDPAAQLIIYEPGATNIDTNVMTRLIGYASGSNSDEIVVWGTPGVADPGVPVVLANESSGDTTTVLSDNDGSFVSFVHGRGGGFCLRHLRGPERRAQLRAGEPPVV